MFFAVVISAVGLAVGGILILLFGAIAVIGIRATIKLGDAILEPRNLAIGSIMIVAGIGGLSVGTTEFNLSGIGLAALIGVILNLILPQTSAYSETD